MMPVYNPIALDYLTFDVTLFVKSAAKELNYTPEVVGDSVV